MSEHGTTGRGEHGARVTVEKSGMRGRWRWYYWVDWPIDADTWTGVGGWAYTKSDAQRMAHFTLKHYDRVMRASAGDLP